MNGLSVCLTTVIGQMNSDEVVHICSELGVSNEPSLWMLIVLGIAALVLFFLAFIIISGLYQKRDFSSFLFEASESGKPVKPSISRFKCSYGISPWPSPSCISWERWDCPAAVVKALFQPELLVLLGISNGTYILGKKIKQGAALPKE